MSDKYNALLTLPDELYRIEVNNLFDTCFADIESAHTRISSWSLQVESCLSIIKHFESKLDFYHFEDYLNDLCNDELKISDLEDKFSSLNSRFKCLEDRVDKLTSYLDYLILRLVKDYEDVINAKAKAKND